MSTTMVATDISTVAPRTERSRRSARTRLDAEALGLRDKDLTIRPATRSDSAALDALRATAARIGGAHAYFGLESGRDGVIADAPWPAGGTTLVAEFAGEIVAAARFEPGATSGEADVVVALGDVPAMHEIGRRLVDELALAAHRGHYSALVADLFTTSATMLAVLVRSGYPAEIGVGDGLMHMRLLVDPAGRVEQHSQVRAVPLWEEGAGANLAELFGAGSDLPEAS